MAGLVAGEIDVGALPHGVRKFEFKRHLQSGAFGTVWHAKATDGKDVAVKVQRRHIHMLQHEMSVLSDLAPHPHILEPVHTEQCDGTAVLVTELCDTDLLTCISDSRKLPLHKAIKIFRQLLHGVQHMHENGIHHCDLKPENVLLAKGVVKLADFGASAKGNTFTVRNLGSAQYLCPELLTWREGQKVDMAASDVWSLGVVFFTMVVGYQPWSQPTMSDIHFSQFVSGSMRFPSSMSPEAVDFVLAMLTLDPLERPTVTDLLQWPLMQAGVECSSGARPSRVTMLDMSLGRPVHTAAVVPLSPTSDGRGSDMDRTLSGESKDSAGSMPKSPVSAGRRGNGAPSTVAAAPSSIATPNTARQQPWKCSLGVTDLDDMSDDESYCAVSPKARVQVSADFTTTVSVHEEDVVMA